MDRDGRNARARKIESPTPSVRSNRPANMTTPTRFSPLFFGAERETKLLNRPVHWAHHVSVPSSSGPSAKLTSSYPLLTYQIGFSPLFFGAERETPATVVTAMISGM